MQAPLDALWVDPDIGDPLPCPPHRSDIDASWLDVHFGAPKSASVYFVALRSERRFDDADALVQLHLDAAREAASFLSGRAAVAALPDGPSLQDMLDAEPNAIPERRAELVRQAECLPTLSEPADGLRAALLTHIASAPRPRQRAGDPHLHTHLLVHPAVHLRGSRTLAPLDKIAFADETAAALSVYDRGLMDRLAERFKLSFGYRPGTDRLEIRGITDEDLGVFPGSSCSVSPARQFRARSRVASAA